MELSEAESNILKILENGSEIEENQILKEGETPEAVRSAVSWLEKKGLIEIKFKENYEIVPGEDAGRFSKAGLPEMRIFEMLMERKELKIEEIMDALGEKDGKIAMAQLAKLGLRPSDGKLKWVNDEKIYEKLKERQNILKAISEGKEIAGENKGEIENILKRPGLIEKKIKRIRILKINEMGLQALKELNEEKTIGELTPELISSGAYKNFKFRSYDLNLPGERKERSGYHPLNVLIEEIRQIFASMGFQEIRDQYVEYTGWNMDALFIPQNHPARDMQDTFYLETGEEKIRDEYLKLFERAGKIHKNGTQGYTGWGFDWSIDEAKKKVLRTHTTASTMRALWKEPGVEKAVFSVDRVFRHESVDWKHLAEFHQVEGAIYSKNANLQTLKWLLRKFYGSLGFDSIELVPSYYPYTEPSMDVVVKIDGREVEMGGSGVIRGEVREILGLKYPVIAWGLGLERLAMLYSDLKDIRGIYNSDLEWLRNYRIRV